MEFDINKVNSNICAGCVTNKYCTHKTGKYDNFSFPFNINDIKLFYISFPDALRRQPPTK